MVLAVSCAALPPATLIDVLESAAGTVFEAIPFILGGELAARWLRAPRLRIWGEALFGCGCAGFPGALSLPALCFCALAFGPGVALLRGLAGAPKLFGMRDSCRRPRNACEQLPSVAFLAFSAALLSALLRGVWAGTGMPVPLLFLAGVLTGALTPCTLGALGLAAGMRATAFPFTLGILWSAGILGLPARSSSDPQLRSGRLVYAGIALACGVVAVRGGAGLLHPKLAPLMVAGAYFACVRALDVSSDCRVPYAILPVLFVLLSAPMLRTPTPSYDMRAATPEHLFIGEEVEFSGMLARNGGASVVFRSVITCCRADAVPLALRLDRILPESDGAWIDVRGKVVRDARGLLLRASFYRHIKRPSDPFLYR